MDKLDLLTLSKKVIFDYGLAGINMIIAFYIIVKLYKSKTELEEKRISDLQSMHTRLEDIIVNNIRVLETSIKIIESKKGN